MIRPRRLGFGSTVMGSLIGVSALHWALLSAFDAQAFSGCTVGETFGWLVPPLSGALIGGVAWLLMERRGENKTPGELQRATCPVCASPVITEWRMCPQCGNMLDAGAPEG